MEITWIGSPFSYDRRDGTPLAAVWHIAAGTLDGCDGWFNHPGNADGLAAHAAIARFQQGVVHQYVRGSASAHACGITEGAAPADHGHAAWLIRQIGPIASPNRFTYNIETEGQSGWKLDADVLATAIEYGAFLWCPRDGCPEHDYNNPDHGILRGVPCDRDHNLRHGEIGGHPLCPGYTDDEMRVLIAGINAKLAGTAPQIPAWAVAAMAEQSFGDSKLETHGLDSAQTSAAFEEMAKHFTDVVSDSEGAQMLAVVRADGITIPAGRKAALVIY